MSLVVIVFVVLMVLWAVSAFPYPTPQPWAAPIASFVPWCCVAILGWVVFRL
jgi:hypothetical protein